MTVSSDNAARPLEGSRKDVPSHELVVAAVFGPLADALARALARLRVPPPAVVLANACAGLLAALALSQEALVVAAVLLQLKTLLDNADGQLARVSGRVTLLGRYLDTEADLAVNVVLFAALGALTGELWLAAAAFVALALVLSVDHNVAVLDREANTLPTGEPLRSGGAVERVLERAYQLLFAPQDRLVRGVSARRLERVLRDVPDPARRKDAALAYHDRATVAVLANLGLSTQLVALGACLVLGAPEAYLWLALGQVLLLPVLQLRRERLARVALRGPS
jgi:phosphatidylglycerophosphate synthase